jgi:glycosyltransferase involved in cell wall biosynthesis
LYIPCSRHFTKERSYQIHELWVPVFAASVMFQIQLMLKLSLDIIRHRPRMLYVRHSLLLFVAVLIGRLFNIPTVLEVNGKLIEEARHHGRSLLTILLDRSHIFSFIEGFNLRNATYVVAVTEGIKSYLVERYTLSPRVVAVINNGVNTETFMPQDMSYARSQIGLPQDRIIVGYIGSFYSWQGLPHILEAARQLRDAGEPMLFVLVGHGADEACLRKGLKRNKLESTVMLIPSIQRSNVPLYINAFDICLSVPTRFRNGATSPFKVYEYLACGKPTIVSDIDGMREEFQDAVYYVEPESPKALVAALRVLAHNGDARGACSMRARSFIREGHDWRTIAQRIASLVSGDSTPGDEALMKAERNAELCASRNLS